MREDLRLFIQGKEVEFSSGPKIAYNYKEKDLRNPAIVKNSYSKSIEIDGTERNNDIFDNIWRLDRTQDYGLFNPMKKAPFELYLNGELLEKGYVKLNSIKKTGNQLKYSINLLGGLGQFFYQLAYDEDSDSDRKKTLADLYFTDGYIVEPNLDFTINKESVYQAWQQIDQVAGATTDDKWNVINFAPCYNGIPEDFDAGKVLVNNSGITGNTLYKSYNDGTKTYQGIINGAIVQNGYSLGETSEEMTCDETRDMRSYLQRPVISVYRTILACCQPESNDGWYVDLDSHFFHQENPYFRDAWMTLPMLKDMEITGGQTEEITGATISNSTATSSIWRKCTFSYSSTLGQMNSVRISVNPVFIPDTGQTLSNTLYSHNYWETTNGNTINGSTYVRHFERGQGVVFQLIGRDVQGNVVAQSKAIACSNNKYAADGKTPIWDKFWNDNQTDGTQPDYEWYDGKWVKSGSTYVFCNREGRRKDVVFTLPEGVAISSLEMRMQMLDSDKTKYKFSGSEEHKLFTQDRVRFYNYETTRGAYGLKTLVEVKNSGATFGTIGFVVNSFYAKSTDYESMFSGTFIPREKLLSTPFSPADFLIDYCKLFGLYFYIDPSEEAEDPERYPSGVVHIMDRNTFYTDEYVNIEKEIDRGKTMTITPTMAATKFYDFDYEEQECEAGNQYKSTYGYNYGRQLVNTQYNFDANTTKIYDGSVFMTGIMVREKDKYFGQDYRSCKPYIFNGFKYSLFANGSDGYDTMEFEKSPIKMDFSSINDINLKGYDLMPKMQFHTDNNAAAEGSYVLCFFSKPMNTIADYWITDDVLDMVIVNDGNPCWIMTNIENNAAGQTIAKRVDKLPYFTRDLINYGAQEGNIVHSWNFGHPQLTFSPNTYTTEMDSIYDKEWRDYIRDVFDQDSKKVSCYVLMDEHPHPKWLRKYYAFDNCRWVMNEVKDWQIGSYDPVLVEFIKVQDPENYKVGKITHSGYNSISVNPTIVPASGGSVVFTIVMQDCGRWAVRGDYIRGTDMNGNDYYLEPAVSSSAACVSTFRQTIPASTAQTPITWQMKVQDSYESWQGTAVFTQETTGITWMFQMDTSATTIGPESGSNTYYYYAVGMDTSTISGSTDKSWCVLQYINRSDRSFIVSASTNNTGIERTATITLTGQDTDGNPHTCTMTLTQQPPILNVNTNAIAFDYNNTAIKNITLNANSNWTITINDSE